MNYLCTFNMHRKSLLFLLLFLYSLNSIAQQVDRYFYSINTDKGLSHHKVNRIFQDSRGFMWFGTEDGLNRYDGKYFTRYGNDIANKCSISGNIITDIVEDEQNYLWISTAEGGLSRYDFRQPASSQFKQFRHEESNKYSIPENRINYIKDDKRGHLWLATSRSCVVRFNKKTERFDTPVLVGTRGISGLYLDEKGILLVAKVGGGVLKINTITLSYETDPMETVFGQNVSLMHAAFAGNEVKCFAQDSSHHFWMGGTEDSGLKVYDEKSRTYTNYLYNPLKEGSLVNNHVNCIFVDRSNAVWIGTNNGISVYNPLYQPFEKVYLPDQKADVVVYDFYKDAFSRLWIGTSDGLFIKDPHSGKFEHRTLVYKGTPLAVTKFYTDIDGTFYLGTNYSLFTYNRQKNKLAVLPNTDLDPVMKRIVDSKIVSIVRDTISNHPVLIVSPYGQYITYYDFTDKRWVSKADPIKKIIKKFNLKDNLIHKLYKANDGDIWVATAKYGLGDWNPNLASKIKYQRENRDTTLSLNEDDVFDVQEGAQGNLWVSTYGGGLKYYNSSTHRVFHINESSNLSEGIQMDFSGNIWMVCNGHMHKYDPQTADYSCYEPPGLHRDSGLSGYIYKDNQGKMYVGGMNYFVIFDPAKVENIDHSPNVYFTDFRIFDTSYNELLSKKDIKLQYDQKYFSVEFSAPEYNGDNIQYAYMLEGMDKKWIKSGKRNYAVYANLPAGDYTFKVKAGNWQGIFGNNVTAVKITILAPVWATSWFYTLVALFVIGIAVALYRYRIKELLNRQEVRNRIAVDLHDNIGSTLSSISVYSQVAKIYQQQQNNYQLNKVLDTIGETASEMISEMGDIVWAINPKNDHLSSIYSRMDSYARPVCKAKDISLDLQCDPRVPFLKLEMNVRKNIYLIFKEAINNSLKYSECNAIAVKLYLKDGNLILSIYDNGTGFDQNERSGNDEQSLSGNGMRNMKMRANEINAQLKIFSSNNGRGTLIEVRYTIP
jgi:streptogramin lyase/ribosomal protein S24E